MENEVALRGQIYNQILNVNEVKDVFEIFRILEFPENSILDSSSKRKKSTFEFRKDDEEKIKEIYSVLNLDEKLSVFLIETTTLQPSFVRSVTNTFDRVFPIIQEDLLQDGWNYPENYENGKFEIGEYEGNKWGGKYLQAPDIFYSILKRGNFIKLSKIGKLRRGYIPQPFGLYLLRRDEVDEGNFKGENILPVFSSPRDFRNIIPRESNRYLLVFDNLSEIENNSVIYEWFQNKKKELEVKERYNFGLGRRETSQIVIVRTPSDRHIVFLNEGLIVVDHVELITKKEAAPICAILNSSLYMLFREIYGRTSLGLGTLKFEVMDAKKLPFINLESRFSKLKIFLERLSKREILSVFDELGISPDKLIINQEPNPLPDRAELDNIIFDELVLIPEERKEVYWSVCELVKQRIDKAKSLRD